MPTTIRLSSSLLVLLTTIFSTAFAKDIKRLEIGESAKASLAKWDAEPVTLNETKAGPLKELLDVADDSDRSG